MKNTQIKALYTCIAIFVLSIIVIVFSMENNYFASAFIGIFIAISSFLVTFLFISRARCMAKMLDGRDLIVSWQYSTEETIKNIQEVKEDNDGRLALAIPFFSFVAIIIIITIGIASENIGKTLIAVISIILANILLFKIVMAYEPKEKFPQRELKSSEIKNRYVYISSTGIYAHGMLNVWKGWGSKLESVLYNSDTNGLLFIYTYLHARGFGEYTICVKVPKEKIKVIQTVKERFDVKDVV